MSASTCESCRNSSAAGASRSCVAWSSSAGLRAGTARLVTAVLGLEVGINPALSGHGARRTSPTCLDNRQRGLVRADRLPEIRRSDARIDGELGARALDRELAGFQHVAVIGDLERSSG